MVSRAAISCSFRKRTLVRVFEHLFQPLSAWRQKGAAREPAPRVKRNVSLRPMVFDSLEPRLLLNGDVFQAGQVLSLIDGDGTQVTFAMSGAGTGAVSATAGGFDVAVSGSDANTAVNVTTAGGDERAKLHALDVAGSLQGFTGATLDLTGSVAVSGTLAQLTLGNIAAPHQITVSGSGVPLQFTAGDVVDLSLDAASAVGNVNVQSWQDLDAIRDVIRAPSIGTLKSAGDFGASLELTGQGAVGFTLMSAQIGGAITGGLWNVQGRAFQILAQSIAPDWQGSFTAALQSLTVAGDLSAQIATPAIQIITVGGDLEDARIYAGANLGADGQFGGSGAAADTFGKGTLARLRVTGSIIASEIYIGVDPQNGIFDDGDDQFVAGSGMQELIVGQAIDAQSFIVSPLFPPTVRVNGVNAPSGTFPALKTQPRDLIAPTLTAALTNDTGALGDDRLTRDPTVEGRVIDLGTIIAVRAKFDDAADFTDVTAQLQPDGRFTLDRATLNALAGGVLRDGDHALQIEAVDGGGNRGSIELAFMLDTTAPDAPVVALDAGSDTGAFDDDRITSDNTPTLTLAGEAGSTIALLQDNLATGDSVAGPSGQVTLGSLADNSYAFSARATDLAGNTSTSSASVLVTIDTQAPAQPSLDLAAAFDTDPIGDRQTTLAGVTLEGSTEAQARVLLLQTAAETIADNSGAFQFAGISLTLGANVFTVRASDLAGNSSESTRTITRLELPPEGDTEAPVIQARLANDTGRSAADSVSQDPTVTGTLTDASAIVSFRAGLDATPQANFVDVLGELQNGNFTLSPADLALIGGGPLAQGPHTLHLIASDGEGNTSSVFDFAFTFDTVAPTVSAPDLLATSDSGADDADNLTNDATPTIRVQAEDGALVQLFVDGNEAARGVAAGGFIDFTLGPLPDRTYLLTAIAEDLAGNVRDAFGAPTVTIDTQAPSQPAFDLAQASDTAPIGDHITTEASVTLAGTTSAQARVELTATGAQTTADGSGNFQFAGIDLALGANPLTVLAFDAAGNQSEFSRTITRTAIPGGGDDTDAPILTAALVNDSGQSATDGLTNDARVSGTIADASAIASFKAGFDALPESSFLELVSIVRADGAFSLSAGDMAAIFGGTLTEGAHTLHLIATDAAGNRSQAFDLAFTIDTLAPVLTIDDPADGATVTHGAELSGTADGTGSPVTSLLYTLETLQPIAVTVESNGDFGQTLALDALGAGAHELQLDATDAAGNARSVSLTLNLEVPFTITGHAPSDGMERVGVQARPRIDFSLPVDPTSLDSASLHASVGGETLPLTIVKSNGGRLAWLYAAGGLPGGAEIEVTVNGDLIRGPGGVALDADGDGVPGGVLNFTFRTASIVPLPGTTLSGRVLDVGPDFLPLTADDVAPGLDGKIGTDDDVFLNPVAGVPVFLLGLEDKVVHTDADGVFHFDAVPAGDVKVVIDGQEVSGPAGFAFPEVVLDLTLAAATANNLGAIYLPRLGDDVYANVSAVETTTVTLAPGGAFGLTDEQRQQFTLTIAPDSLLSAAGQRMATGEVGIGMVPTELLAPLLPTGMPPPLMAFTVQTRGFTDFAEPAQLTLPNLSGAAPGTQFLLLTFDHTTKQLINDGTVVVSSAPGAPLVATLNGRSLLGTSQSLDDHTLGTFAGRGITFACFHILVPGSPGDPCPPLAEFEKEVEPKVEALGLDDNWFFTDDEGEFEILIRNNAEPIDPSQDLCGPENRKATPLILDIEIEGPAGEFLTGLEGVRGMHGLLPGEKLTFRVSVKDLLGGNAVYDQDRFYGASVKVIGYASNKPSEKLLDKEFYIYRYLDVADGSFDSSATPHADGVIEMSDTLNDGLAGVTRERLIDVRMPAEVEVNTTLTVADDKHFPQPTTLDKLIFDPQEVGKFATSIGIITPDGKAFANVLLLMGQGTPKYKVFVDTTNLENVLKGIVASRSASQLNEQLVTSIELAMFDTDPERAAIAEKVRDGILSRFAEFSPGIESGSDPNDKATITVTFGANLDGRELGNSKVNGVGDGVDSQTFIEELARIANQPGRGEGERMFLLSEALNQNPQTPVIVWAGTHLQGQTAPLNLSREQFINALVKTGAHEVAHTLGAAHAAKSKLQFPPTDEIQKLSFAGITGGITLAFNESTPTAKILPAASPEEVQQTLGLLPNVVKDNITVSKSSDGEFTITFVRDFQGIDVPQLVARDAATGNVLVDVVSTETNGLSTLEIEGSGNFAKEINRGSSLGKNDMMGQGFPDYDGTHRFLPGLSREVVRVGLHIDWTPDEAESAIKYLKENIDRNIGAPGTIFDRLEGVETIELLAGAHLGLYQTDTGPVFGALDVGIVTADGAGGASATRTLNLISLGDASVVLHDVELIDPTGSWTISPVVAGTVIAPGQALPLELTFDPLATGSLDATLRVSSNDSDGIREIALRGSGLSLTGDVRLEMSNNNRGGRALNAGSGLNAAAATIRNIGAGALTITGVNVTGESAAQFGVIGFPAGFGAGNPLVLASGETFTFDVTFDPSVLGLQRAQIEIASNDPDTPVLRQAIVGTGLADQGSALEYAHDFVAVEFPAAPEIPAMRTVSDANGNWTLFLSARQAYHSVIFDPTSGLVAHGFGITAASGVETHLLSPLFRASTAPDTDGDGLPDDVEFAIGSALDAVDTDDDGLDDFAEIRLGGNPLDGVAGRSGILGALRLDGAAWDIAFDGTTAYVAMDDAGLAVVDLSDPLAPILIGSVDLLGVSSSVAVDDTRALAVLGSQFIDPGLRIVDISDPTAPQLVRTISLPAGVSQVEALDGIAYAASGTALLAIELASGDALQTLALGGTVITGLARDGELLFAMDSGGKLSAIDISEFQMVVRDSLTVSHGGGGLSVGGGIAYLANRTGFFGGFSTVDVADPDDLVLISNSDIASGIRPDSALAADGSGGVLIVGNAPDPQNPGGSIDVVDVADASDPTNTGVYLNRFPLPDFPLGVAIASGFGLIADADAGLLVVGYRSDAGGVAPSVVLRTLADDVDPAANGIQVAAGSLMHLLVDASDDVLVKNVELLVNGESVAADLSFPYETLLAAAKTGALSLQARATDVGGNVALSNVLTIDVVADTFAPTLLAIDPPDDASRPEGLQEVTVRFDEALAPETVTAANFRILDSGGQPVAADVVLRSEGRVAELSFAGLVAGDYQILIAGANVTDVAGNALSAADVVSDFTLTGDAIAWINPAGGFWDVASNWEGGVLPGPNDNVLIDVPGADVTITHRSGTSVVNRVISRENLLVTGGTLDIATTLLVDEKFEIGSGATLKNATILDGEGVVPTVTSFAIFDGVSLADDLVVGAGGTLQVRNGLDLQKVRIGLFGSDLSFSGAQTLIGIGEVFFGSPGTPSRISAGEGLTIGQDITIHGNRGRLNGFTSGLRLEGTVNADMPGETITIEGAWTNAGRLVGGAGRLELDGTFTIEERGIFDASKGQVVLTGILDNDGKTLTIDATSGSLTMDDGRIRGGRLELADGVRLGLEATGTLEGVTLGSDHAIVGARELVIVGGLTLDDATIELIDDNGGLLLDPELNFAGTQALQGTGRILFTGPGDDGALRVTGSSATLTIGPGITINSTAPSLGLNGRFINQGVIAFETNTTSSIFVTTASFVNEGTLRLLNGADMTIQNLTNAGGTITLGAGSTISGVISTQLLTQTAGVIDLQGGTINVGTLDIQGGMLVGAGTIDANVINAGRIAPGSATGDQTGTMAITNGNYTQTATGVLAIQLGGTAAADYDRLTIALLGAPLGTATLGGTLDVSLVSGFTPALANVFDILTYEALTASSTFATVTGLNLGDELSLQPSIESTRVRLQVVSSPAPGLLSEPTIDLGAGATFGAGASDAPMPEDWQRPWLFDFVNGSGYGAEPLIVTVP